jgi:8-oxo-dGTP diphosphatase
MGEEASRNLRESPSMQSDKDNDDRPFTEVAVGLVHRPQPGRSGHFEVLMGQRPAGKPYAGWWEFPGGKIESGESVAAALARELAEELALHVRDSLPWVVRTHSYPHARVRLHFRRIFEWAGEPASMEKQAFAWQALDRIVLEPLLPAALPLLDMLRWPARAILLGFKERPATLDQLQALVEDSTLVAGDRIIVRLSPARLGLEAESLLTLSQARLKVILQRATERALHIYLDQAWHELGTESAGLWRRLDRDGLFCLEVIAAERFFETDSGAQTLSPRALVLMEATEVSDARESDAEKGSSYRLMAEQVELPLFWPRQEYLALGGHGYTLSL